jgi:phosphate-selective porin OprO/OprP
MKKGLALAAALWMAPGSSASEETRTAEEMLLSLEQRLEALEQQIRILERALEVERELAAERASQTPTVAAGRDGFQFQSADGNFLLRLRGYFQADGLWVANEGSEVATSSLFIRRARPVIDATMFQKFDFSMMPDFGQGRTVLQHVYAAARFSPSVNLRAGKYKAPFGLERLVTATDLAFVERTLPTALAPNRDVGVMLYGDLAEARVSYEAGVFNGVVDGGSADFNADDGKDFVGRVMVHPFRGSGTERWEGLGLGMAVSAGPQEGTVLLPNLPTLGRVGRVPYFRFRSDGTAAGTVFADGSHWRLSPQGYYYGGQLGLMFEYVKTVQDVRREEATAAIASDAWQVAGSWVLTGETSSYKSVRPRRDFDPARGTWGAFEIVARASRLTIEDEAFPVFASPEKSVQATWIWTGGFNWYFNRSFKLNVNYEEARFQGGVPAGDRAVERDLLTRLQFSF